ncbi:uncharacterized protein A4U43_C03F11810 [Asparagus officinalis]|uniref:F-box associated domain-containing protein n=1 Tax=Asparagus officinalis TaxID=4686 RepID=A0A5P1FA28_ASPOF|nr:uncharacterized protein A4U43_C03F11810 [Asparagus officinalis]
MATFMSTFVQPLASSPTSNTKPAEPSTLTSSTCATSGFLASAVSYLSSIPCLGLGECGLACICSSAHGLLLFRNPISKYYIINPFVKQEYCGISRQIPAQPHQPQDPAILAFNNVTHAYHIICPVKIGTYPYRFDVFSSPTRQWAFPSTLDEDRSIRIGLHIRVSCGSIAYWLATRSTTEPIFVRYNVETNCVTELWLPIPTRPRMLQVGRVGGNVGLVLLSEGKVELYLLLGPGDERTPFWFLDVRSLRSMP